MKAIQALPEVVKSSTNTNKSDTGRSVNSAKAKEKEKEKGKTREEMEEQKGEGKNKTVFVEGVGFVSNFLPSSNLNECVDVLMQKKTKA